MAASVSKLFAVGCVLVFIGWAGSATTTAAAAGATVWSINSDPVWSPDGKSIAWTEINAAGNRYRIETAAALAKAVPHTIYTSRPFPGGCCDPIAWTPSGRILYIAYFTLFSIPAAGGRPTVLFHGNAGNYILSPNQETVAVVDGCACGKAPDKLALVNVRGGSPYVLPAGRNVSDEPVAFSPDGTELVFSTATLNRKTSTWSHVDLMAVHVGGGTPVPLAQSGILGARFLTTRMTYVSWSPDGTRIAAWITPTWRLITIDTQSGRTTVVAPPGTEAWAYSWAPDSSRLAYAATLRLGNDDQEALATVKPDGSARIVFWKRASKLYYAGFSSRVPPAWSPDSKRLVFLASAGYGSNPLEIYTAAADGTGLTKLQ